MNYAKHDFSHRWNRLRPLLPSALFVVISAACGHMSTQMPTNWIVVADNPEACSYRKQFLELLIYVSWYERIEHTTHRQFTQFAIAFMSRVSHQTSPTQKYVELHLDSDSNYLSLCRRHLQFCFQSRREFVVFVSLYCTYRLHITRNDDAALFRFRLHKSNMIKRPSSPRRLCVAS